MAIKTFDFPSFGEWKKTHDYYQKIGDYTCVISIVTFGVKDVWKEAVAITNYNIDKAEVCTGYTLFRNYVFGGTMRLKSKLYISRKCYKFIKRLCREKKLKNIW